MNRFITLQEHYCSFFEKNIVIEKELTEDVSAKEGYMETNVCLYSRDCHCGDQCRNRLLNLEIQMKR